MLLNGPSDVTQVIPGSTLLNRELKAFFGNSDQLHPIFVDFTNRYCRRGVANKPFQRCATIDRENVAFLQLVIRGKAMDNLLVYRRANRVRESVVTFEGRDRSSIANHLFSDAIDLDCSDAGF